MPIVSHFSLTAVFYPSARPNDLVKLEARVFGELLQFPLLLSL